MAAAVTKPRILCLDGGGIRGLSEILILKELMLQVRIQNHLDYTPEPRQCFDFICGTSTGGLVGTLLGRLGRTLDECEELFRTLGSEIFHGNSLQTTSRLVLKGSRHASKGLADVVRHQAGEEKMYEVDAPTAGHVPVSQIHESTDIDIKYSDCSAIRSPWWQYRKRPAMNPCSAHTVSEQVPKPARSLTPALRPQPQQHFSLL